MSNMRKPLTRGNSETGDGFIDWFNDNIFPVVKEVADYDYIGGIGGAIKGAIAGAAGGPGAAVVAAVTNGAKSAVGASTIGYVIDKIRE